MDGRARPADSGGAQAVFAQLGANPADERWAWEASPSLKALFLPIARGILYVVALPLAAYLAYAPVLRWLSGLGPAVRRFLAQSAPGVRLAVVAAVALVALVQVAKLAWRIVALKSLRYRVSNQRIQIESGVVSKRLEELDIRTVEDLSFHQGLLDRLLGIGSIDVVSADKTAARLRLVGVADPRAVREEIRAHAYRATRSQVFTRST
jgi:uncharacterized membrane protein YdbT with pleckstrin-like domain